MCASASVNVLVLLCPSMYGCVHAYICVDLCRSVCVHARVVVIIYVYGEVENRFSYM